MKAKKLMKGVGFLLLFVFICSYVIEMSGYYEYNLQSKKNLTEEQMKQFENDVKEGKEIDLNQYLQESSVDYSNKLTRTASEASIRLNEYLKVFLNNGFRLLSELVK